MNAQDGLWDGVPRRSPADPGPVCHRGGSQPPAVLPWEWVSCVTVVASENRGTSRQGEEGKRKFGGSLATLLPLLGL